LSELSIKIDGAYNGALHPKRKIFKKDASVSRQKREGRSNFSVARSPHCTFAPPFRRWPTVGRRYQNVAPPAGGLAFFFKCVRHILGSVPMIIEY
jgi:hypothetical protein